MAPREDRRYGAGAPIIDKSVIPVLPFDFCVFCGRNDSSPVLSHSAGSRD